MATVSVCIPVYNGEKFIGEAIRSVLSQTYTNFELIIFDNASTDNTSKVIEGFKDERIKHYKNNENIGGLNNLNKCLDYATGDYIKFLCADDVLKRNVLSKMIKLSEKNKVDIVFCNYDVIDEKSELIQRKYGKKNKFIKKGNDTIIEIITEKLDIPICPSFFLITNKVKQEIKNFLAVSGSGYNSDLEFVTRILSEFNGYYTSEILACNRKHKMQGTNIDLNGLNAIIEPINFRKYIIKKHGLKLSSYQEFCMKFGLFHSALHHIAIVQRKKVDFNSFMYLKDNFSIVYFLVFPFYIVLKYIPRKILYKLLYYKYKRN